VVSIPQTNSYELSVQPGTPVWMLPGVVKQQQKKTAKQNRIAGGTKKLGLREIEKPKLLQSF